MPSVVTGWFGIGICAEPQADVVLQLQASTGRLAKLTVTGTVDAPAG